MTKIDNISKKVDRVQRTLARLRLARLRRLPRSHWVLVGRMDDDVIGHVMVSTNQSTKWVNFRNTHQLECHRRQAMVVTNLKPDSNTSTSRRGCQLEWVGRPTCTYYVCVAVVTARMSIPTNALWTCPPIYCVGKHKADWFVWIVSSNSPFLTLLSAVFKYRLAWVSCSLVSAQERWSRLYRHQR